MPRTFTASTPQELEEILNDGTQLSNLMSEGEFPDFVKAYARTQLSGNIGTMIREQVTAQTDEAFIDFMQKHGATEEQFARGRLAVGDPMAAAPRRQIYNKGAIGAKHDDAFPDMSTFLHAISNHSHKDIELSRKLTTLRNDLSSVRPSDGGYLIPERLRAELLRVSLERAVVRPLARIVPMDSLMVPFPTVDSTSNVSSVYGGWIGYWTEEGATLTESQPRFGRVELTAHKLCLYTEIPNELLMDSIIALPTFVNELMPEAAGWFEDVACFVGGGVGEPLGYLNADAMVSVTRNTSSEIHWEDVVAMYARMLPQSLNRAVWVISPDVMPQIMQMTVRVQNAAGTDYVGGGPAMIGWGGLPSAPVMTMLGRPIVVSEKASALGSAGDITFTDFGYYLFGDRQALSARQSEDFKFQNDVTAFRVIERIDGQPWIQSAITPYNSSATLSPFVQVAA